MDTGIRLLLAMFPVSHACVEVPQCAEMAILIGSIV